MDFTYANKKTHNNHEFAFISREFLSPVLRTETKTTHGKQIDINKNNMPAQEFSHNYLYYFMYSIISIAGHAQMSFGLM